MWTHPIPRVISFAGSTPMGRNIARLATEGPILNRVELELGGNGPFVVLEDAELERAVDAAVFGKFLHQGRICMSVNRFIIDDSVNDAFLERFADRVSKLKAGDPNEPDTMTRPIINESQLNGLQRRILDAVSAGARQVVGATPKDWFYLRMYFPESRIRCTWRGRNHSDRSLHSFVRTAKTMLSKSQTTRNWDLLPLFLPAMSSAACASRSNSRQAWPM